MHRVWPLIAVSLFVGATAAPAAPPVPSVDAAPAIAIIIDDVGDNLSAGRRAVELPAPVALAFLPHTRFARPLAERAHALHKEVLLHLPLESVDGRPLGPGGLYRDMPQRDFQRILQTNIAAVPHVQGINTHMGSLLTRYRRPMEWLIDVVYGYSNLYFIDSRTTAQSIALNVAREIGVKSMERHVFLDNVQHAAAIADQLDLAIARAHEQGVALVIGHPYPATLAVLEGRLPHLHESGVRLVPVSQLIAIDQQWRAKQWRLSLSPWHRDAKNSKR
ncbi:MAG: divergent polysaccharide deacetylase family protein [Pseudomonadota bacterium]|nr:MAG: divergent polysaccharide deacetylase family protein [Pseudomonadota bacterium]